MARRFLLIIMMLWLPFYTGAAAAMVICKQNLGDSAAATRAMPANHSGHGDAHAGHGEAPGANSHTDQHSYQNADCNQCALCHITCAPWLGQSAGVSFVPASQQYVGAHSDSFSSLASPPSGRPPAI